MTIWLYFIVCYNVEIFRMLFNSMLFYKTKHFC